MYNPTRDDIWPAATAAVPAPVRRTKRRVLVAGLAALVLLAGGALVWNWYFKLCGGCNAPQVLCGHDCALPAIIREKIDAAERITPPPPRRD